jgi:hypothetical protein
VGAEPQDEIVMSGDAIAGIEAADFMYVAAIALDAYCRA